MKKFIDIFPSRVDEYEDLLTSNPIWMGRTQGVGYLSLDDMLDLGVTGPMLRAAGLAADARKQEPYSSYEKFDFEMHRRTSLTASETRANRRHAENRWRQASVADGRPCQASAPGTIYRAPYENPVH